MPKGKLKTKFGGYKKAKKVTLKKTKHNPMYKAKKY
tara:strand:- start:211 stop:318 length:108 start_codon:yes stop_codon:yes gene_type:complete